MAKRSEAGALTQGELFAGRATTIEGPLVTPETVRSQMIALLGELQAADRMPWPERKARVQAVVFPQMADHLPQEEADQMRTEFQRELERLRSVDVV